MERFKFFKFPPKSPQEKRIFQDLFVKITPVIRLTRIDKIHKLPFPTIVKIKSEKEPELLSFGAIKTEPPDPDTNGMILNEIDLGVVVKKEPLPASETIPESDPFMEITPKQEPEDSDSSGGSSSDSSYKNPRICKVPPSLRNKCKLCPRVFIYPKTLQNHVRLVHSTVYKCLEPGCEGKTFQNKNKLTCHQKDSHPPNPGSYQCEICSKFLKSRTGLRKHKLLYHREIEKSLNIKCPHGPCPLKFRTQNFLKTHLISVDYHRDPFTIGKKRKCPTCGKLTHKSALKSHMATHLDVKDRELPCGICGKLLAGKNNLRTHMGREHKENKGEFKCEEEGCGKSFTMLSYLRNHMTSHGKEKIYKCSVCPSEFARKTKLDKHVLHYHRETMNHKFKCPEEGCMWTFDIKYWLDKHVEKHRGVDGVGIWGIPIKENPSKEKCSACGRICSRQNMTQHIKTHEDRKPEFKCEVKGCHSIFKFANSLRSHMRHHHDPEVKGRAFICQEGNCDKSYLTSYLLQRHITLIHSPPDPDELSTCQICQKNFTKRHYLRRHWSRTPCGEKVEEMEPNLFMRRKIGKITGAKSIQIKQEIESEEDSDAEKSDNREKESKKSGKIDIGPGDFRRYSSRVRKPIIKLEEDEESD